ncbi:hypothetical protein C1W78_10985 [Burkholderia pseudomallei]|nr:hypothetical protein [Burkholderia pseudomallei]NAY12767.1 hypothetical protein [Burkholderia pseudomallei]NAY38916.1 hypothetical protein [Burkholderia pseudomallei]NAY44969.1 hypothetical protein [Burkholderia pseudomallei]NAY51678.1 hypothetical protein [Burkholderia pseudomallei]
MRASRRAAWRACVRFEPSSERSSRSCSPVEAGGAASRTHGRPAKWAAASYHQY